MRSWKAVDLAKRKTWMLFFLIFATMAMVPFSVSADGVSPSPEGSPSTPGNGSIPNDSTGLWPPKGTTPKGSFVPGAFDGTWYAFVDNTAFTLIIEQEGQIIKVAHTAVYDYGRRVDSSVGGVSMAGTVSGAIAYVEWKSGLSPENGRATLEYLPGRPVTLHWKIADSPKKEDEKPEAGIPVEVAYFLPASAYLIRK